MNIAPPEPRDIPVDEIEVMFKRARKKDGFEGVKAAMKQYGLKVPIQVRDRGRKNGDGFRYDLIVGEGRLTAAKELKWEVIPAIVVKAESAEFAGRFLAENMIREPLPWATNARLLREEMRATGEPIELVAHRLCISYSHARNILRITENAHPRLAHHIAAMPWKSAAKLTTLPPNGQRIVVEVAEETGAPVEEVAEKARNLTEGWTKSALHAELRKLDDNLKKARAEVKTLRLHYSLGPANIQTLLKQPGFKAACKVARVNLTKIEA